MADNTMDVDDIDAESLQAQIDMSMSLIQNLVSSWMKPSESKKSTKPSNMETEKELEELMRRPPRCVLHTQCATNISLLLMQDSASEHQSRRLRSRLAMLLASRTT